MKFRCPGCERIYKAEFYAYAGARARTHRRRSTRGLLRVLDPGSPTSVRFELTLRHPHTRAQKSISYLAMSASRSLEDFRFAEEVALVFFKETMVAVCNLVERRWMTTFSGGLWRAKTYLPFVAE